MSELTLLELIRDFQTHKSCAKCSNCPARVTESVGTMSMSRRKINLLAKTSKSNIFKEQNNGTQ